MINVLDTSASRLLDKLTVRSGKQTEVTLMRNAGRAVADEAALMLGGDKSAGIMIVCGKGHNGGDGFAAAEFLTTGGYTVEVVSTGAISEADSTVGETIAAANIRITENACPETGPIPDDIKLLIDGLLGIGVDGPLREPISAWADAINEHSAKVLSIDVPSGVSTDTGQVWNAAVQADVTLTMGYHKLGLLVSAGPDYAGEVKVADIGFLPDSFDEDKTRYYQFTGDDFAHFYQQPDRRTFKHRQGKCLVIAGSLGMTGAAILSTRATLLSGAGLTVAPCPASLQPLYASGSPEIITLGLDDNGRGLFIPEHVPQIRESLSWCTAVVLGPGLSRSPQTEKFIQAIFEDLEVPTILDADGLMAFTANVDMLNATQTPMVLTPHAREFARLFDHDLVDVMENPVQVLAEVRSYFPHTVVLKGAPTCTLLASGDIVINSTGNAGMATAGSGDVLSGVIGTFLSQGHDPDEAASMGVWIHGRAGDLARAEYGMTGMIATHILEMLPAAFKDFETQE